ncbi:(2Fe-2S)-binding protein [Salipiger mucosus]|uniref:Bacterioferritin-associated ferredoxin n=1 Tax=Salipiger mucosus DSM 16094 TaxID=1123237 RepID=S9QZP6_9RHOB|nr:(2Fe-2S)-binding protein [Salipiger mucosus]EPX85067.1 Bacterioferritin-associated ferredoxin [Salipiger mucosus DSM 16094]
MIVCSCMNISDRDIHAAIDWMRAADEQTIITPGKIYHALGKKADCGGCMGLFLQTMRTNDNLEVPMHLRDLRGRGTTQDKRHEGRR